MDGTIKKILNAVVIIALVLWLLTAFGLLPLGGDLRIGDRRISELQSVQLIT
jgi:hypothetical protein